MCSRPTSEIPSAPVLARDMRVGVCVLCRAVICCGYFCIRLVALCGALACARVNRMLNDQCTGLSAEVLQVLPSRQELTKASGTL